MKKIVIIAVLAFTFLGSLTVYHRWAVDREAERLRRERLEKALKEEEEAHKKFRTYIDGTSETLKNWSIFPKRKPAPATPGKK